MLKLFKNILKICKVTGADAIVVFLDTSLSEQFYQNLSCLPFHINIACSRFFSFNETKIEKMVLFFSFNSGWWKFTELAHFQYAVSQ
jgi:hypothetical protein